MHSQSLQGTHFTNQSFPSSWNTFEENKIFTSTCRCLIDLETKFVVLLPGDRLSMLEVDRKTLIPDDSEVWSKDTCVNKLKEILSNYPQADISSIRFPFFDKPGQSKLRPAITLYSPKTDHMFFVIIYNYSTSAPKQTAFPKHIIEIPSDMTSPKNSPSALIDCSNLCSVPRTNDNGECTYRDWRDKSGHSFKLYDPDPIREDIVRTLLSLASDSPIIHYQDITRKFDWCIQSFIRSRVHKNLANLVHKLRIPKRYEVWL